MTHPNSSLRSLLRHGEISNKKLCHESFGLVDDGDNRAELDEVSLLTANFLELAVVWRLDLDVYLVGFHLEQRLPLLHFGAFRFEPAEDAHLVAFVARPQARNSHGLFQSMT